MRAPPEARNLDIPTMKRTTLSCISLLFAVLLLSGCSDSLQPFEEEPYLEGTVTKIGQDSRGMTRYLVEEDTTVDNPVGKGGIKVWFYLDGDSELLARRAGGSLTPVKESALEIGQTLRGWPRDGILADSYPQQALAERLVIVRAR